MSLRIIWKAKATEEIISNISEKLIVIEEFSVVNKYKPIKHTFTHFHLMIKPIHIKLEKDKDYFSKVLKWIHPEINQSLGLPAPVLSMLVDLNNTKRAILNES